MNPRVEEVSDSDPDEADISSIASPAPSSATNASLISPADIPSARSPTAQNDAEAKRAFEERQRANAASQARERERVRKWQCLYPVYFDSSRTREEGRRVSKELAVPNPLAREIVDGVSNLGLQVVFEPGKTHPKDWANPGRVRVLLKEDGKAVSSVVQNKRHLFQKVAEYLKANPANVDTPMRLKIQGLSPQNKPPPPAIPRGWKMNTILPFHSAALSGGGVSENLFKDMMAEMQGQDGAAPSGGKPKKDKRIKS